MLIQLVYCSKATSPFTPRDLAQLLRVSRANNARHGITGMLLHDEGSFFQVLEGEEGVVGPLFEHIRQDPRHANIVIITQEPVPARAFGDWTMGYSELTAAELDSVLGVNDFFGNHHTFADLGESRAKKLLLGFKSGYWHSQVSNLAAGNAVGIGNEPGMAAPRPFFAPAKAGGLPVGKAFSVAFQPIVDVHTRSIFSYEALLRGKNNEPAGQVLGGQSEEAIGQIDTQSHAIAVQLAAYHGLQTCLNLNILPSNAAIMPGSIDRLLQALPRYQISARQVVLEVVESEMVHDLDGFAAAIRQYRNSGLQFAIDDFGAGYAGLSLLAEFQPGFVKLDMGLVRGVHQRGPRQAIIRGILRTCMELGIDVIAEGVETPEEYHRLRDEGISLFQGYLFARPAFEKLASDVFYPD